MDMVETAAINILYVKSVIIQIKETKSKCGRQLNVVLKTLIMSYIIEEYSLNRNLEERMRNGNIMLEYWPEITWYWCKP